MITTYLTVFLFQSLGVPILPVEAYPAVLAQVEILPQLLNLGQVGGVFAGGFVAWKGAQKVIEESKAQHTRELTFLQLRLEKVETEKKEQVDRFLALSEKQISLQSQQVIYLQEAMKSHEENRELLEKMLEQHEDFKNEIMSAMSKFTGKAA